MAMIPNMHFNEATGEWEPSKPLPYYPQARPSWWKRALIVTLFRKYKCGVRWCSRPAVETGSVCDMHGPWID